MESMFQEMSKILKSRDMRLALAKSIYEESKQETFKELKNEGKSNSATCEIMSKRAAKMHCKYLLFHEFDCSEEEIEEILNEIQSS